MGNTNMATFSKLLAERNKYQAAIKNKPLLSSDEKQWIEDRLDEVNSKIINLKYPEKEEEDATRVALLAECQLINIIHAQLRVLGIDQLKTMHKLATEMITEDKEKQ